MRTVSTAFNGLCLAVAAGLAWPLALQAAEGLYLEQRMSTEQQRDHDESHMRSWVQDERFRMEFVDSEHPLFAAGTYMLSLDGGETSYLVDPAAQTYTRVAPAEIAEQLFAGLTAMEDEGGDGATRQMIDIQFSDVFSEDLGTAAGEPVLGYSTTIHRVRSGYTMELKVLFMTHRQSVETVTELWVTGEIDSPRISAWFDIGTVTGNEESDAALIDPLASISGTVLRSVHETTVRAGRRGRPQQSRSVMEVTALRHESIDSSLFELPAGFAEQSLAMRLGGTEMPSVARGPEPSGGAVRRVGRMFGGVFNRESDDEERSLEERISTLMRVPTGDLELLMDGKALRLQTFLRDDGNTAAWVAQADGSFAVFVNGFHDGHDGYRDTISVRAIVSGFDTPCPCTPERVVIRFHQGDDRMTNFYESTDAELVFTQLDRNGDQLEVAGEFAGPFGFKRDMDSTPGQRIHGEGRFEALANRAGH
ncbi:MAG: hypothetical protein JJU27_06520 [Gammaproteobacteria bacterium]|nr:hypothetical protein [Gammaproteobacteria bacterium]